MTGAHVNKTVKSNREVLELNGCFFTYGFISAKIKDESMLVKVPIKVRLFNTRTLFKSLKNLYGPSNFPIPLNPSRFSFRVLHAQRAPLAHHESA